MVGPSTIRSVSSYVPVDVAGGGAVYASRRRGSRHRLVRAAGCYGRRVDEDLDAVAQHGGCPEPDAPMGGGALLALA
jgi:hypothetical protein